MKKIFKTLAVIILLSVLLPSCKNGPGNDDGSDSVRPPEEPLKELAVNVYLDNTSSMKGYVMADDATEFTEVFSGIFSYYMNRADEINGYYIQSKKSGSNKVIEVKAEKFDMLLSHITKKSIGYTDSYQLNDFFKTIVDNNKDSAHEVVSFFVTDGIPSGTNEEVRRTRSFNIDQRALLCDRIKESLKPLASMNYAAAIFQFNAKYKGEYYKYNNDHRVNLNNVSRPFYVIAIGPQDCINKFYNQIDDGQDCFAPAQKVLYTRSKNRMKINNTEGMAEYDEDTIFINMEDGDGMSNDFEFYIKKDVLPIYADRNSLVILWNNDTVNYRFENEKYKFKLRLNRHDIDKKLEIKFKNDLPSWVDSCHSDNDSNISEKNDVELGKTFNLKYLIKGIKEGLLGLDGSTYENSWKYTIITEK